MAEPESRKEVSAQLPPILPDPATRYQPFPLNDVQQAYWIGRLAPFDLGNVASHSYTEMDLRNVDLDRLGLALQRLIDRHDMLRAVILPDGRQQVLAEVPPYEIRVCDLSRHEPGPAATANRRTSRSRRPTLLPLATYNPIAIVADRPHS